MTALRKQFLWEFTKILIDYSSQAWVFSDRWQTIRKKENYEIQYKGYRKWNHNLRVIRRGKNFFEPDHIILQAWKSHSLSEWQYTLFCLEDIPMLNEVKNDMLIQISKQKLRDNLCRQIAQEKLEIQQEREQIEDELIFEK